MPDTIKELLQTFFVAGFIAGFSSGKSARDVELYSTILDVMEPQKHQQH